MHATTLTARAKRLRTAITKMCQVKITHSQALELVAMEENYPNWDAACASYGKSNSLQASLPPTHNLQIRLSLGETPNLNGLLKDHAGTLQILRNMLNVSNKAGALLLVAGLTGSGKTNTTRLVIEDLIRTHGEKEPIRIAHFGHEEFMYPKSADARYLSDNASLLDEGLKNTHVVVVDEIRSERQAFEAVTLAESGIKVIAIIHATSASERFRFLLERFRAGAKQLDALLADGRFMCLHQEWSLIGKVEIDALHSRRIRKIGENTLLFADTPELFMTMFQGLTKVNLSATQQAAASAAGVALAEEGEPTTPLGLAKRWEAIEGLEAFTAAFKTLMQLR
ncbi:MAG: ATPase, T2SS/T4P/T4SS family [Hafnia sp.]